MLTARGEKSHPYMNNLVSSSRGNIALPTPQPASSRDLFWKHKIRLHELIIYQSINLLL